MKAEKEAEVPVWIVSVRSRVTKDHQGAEEGCLGQTLLSPSSATLLSHWMDETPDCLSPNNV